MKCEDCNIDMELVEGFEDYFDPGDYSGHGQYDYKLWQCPECQRTEDYIPD